MPKTVCLNMIVKDEAPVIRRCLDSVRPFIDCWVIVDTGSTDGTQDIVRTHFAGVPGELHERPWRNFGHNRTEALDLARGKADYVLIMDADNIFRAPDGWHWPELTEDAYYVSTRSAGIEYSVCLLLADRLRWRYEGVVHECVTTDAPHRVASLQGPWVDRRHEGARSRDPSTFRKDAALLEEALRDAPGNARYVFYLAQSWRDAGQHAKALEAYRRRVAMGGWEEEVWYSLYQIAILSERLGAPLAEIRSAYLDAFQHRPRRAEPLVALARLHRERKEWALSRLFAETARALPRPDDRLFVDEAAYRWRADDEAAIAAYWTGDPARCFELCWALLDSDRLPDSERPRVEANRDFAVPAVAARTAGYPENVVRRLADRKPVAGVGRGVTLSITSCRRLELFERTVSSLLNCCRDIDRVDRFVCVDDNSSGNDRVRMQARYPFFEFIFKGEDEKGHARSMNRLLDAVATPYWLHLEDDWHFFVTTDYIARALAILDAEPALGQVLFNRNYAETLADRALVGGSLRRDRAMGLRYIVHEFFPDEAARAVMLRRHPPGVQSNAYWPHFSLRPSLMRTDAIRAVGRFHEAPGHFELEFARRYAGAGLQSAFFDAITCLHTGRLTTERNSGKANAYDLNAVRQF